jgi:hypothetical protein
MRWQLVLEEFDPDLQHVKGGKNIVANALVFLTSANALAATKTISRHALSQHSMKTLPKRN